MPEQQKILIIIPAFNEDKNIRKVIEDTQELGFLYDIVVIDDGSTDTTAEIVMNMGINLISHPINLGAGAAVQSGLKYALVKRYNMAGIIDGDGQHDPKEIPKLIKALKENFVDVVVGSRFLLKGAGQTHWARRIGIYIFSMIASHLGRCKITDTTSGFRVFNQKTIKFLSREIPADFPDADLLLSLIFSGFKIIEEPVSSRQRQDGQSMYTFLRSIYYPFKVVIAILAVFLRMVFKNRRL